MVPSRARGVGRRALAAGLLGLVLLLGRAAAAGGAQDAERFVSALGERTLVALRGSADPQQRVRDLAGLLDQAVDVELVGGSSSAGTGRRRARRSGRNMSAC